MTSPLKRVTAIFNYGNLEGDNRYKRRLVMFFLNCFKLKTLLHIASSRKGMEVQDFGKKYL